MKEFGLFVPSLPDAVVRTRKVWSAISSRLTAASESAAALHAGRLPRNLTGFNAHGDRAGYLFEWVGSDFVDTKRALPRHRRARPADGDSLEAAGDGRGNGMPKGLTPYDIILHLKPIKMAPA